MRFNISYLGPEWLFHLRRDFILLLKFSLEDLGHTVTLSGLTLDSSSVNLLIGAYFLDPTSLKRIQDSKIKYINVNTEVIANDMLNFNPEKVDFLNSYLPLIKNGITSWETVIDNIPEYEKYHSTVHFLRWGYHDFLCDITHKKEKDLDYYFFGMLSQRRLRFLERINKAGFRGLYDNTCPYFLRNDRISRAKINLNIIQDDKYNHVNAFRICYLANNRCMTLSELENDPAGYLRYAEIVDIDNVIDKMSHYISNNNYQDKADEHSQLFMEHKMVHIMEKLIENTF